MVRLILSLPPNPSLPSLSYSLRPTHSLIQHSLTHSLTHSSLITHTSTHLLTPQIVGGPNARTDYHINQTPEWFYQYRGAMLLKVVDDGHFKDIVIREGEMFLLPGNTPHNPVRFANTVGLVLEQKRPEGSLDKMRWYCQACSEIVHEEAFHCTDLGTQIKKAVEDFRESAEARTCKACGAVADWKPAEGSIKDPNME
jgi:3-hydroxyanthranilate 3,4-dioxygenase